MDYAIGEFIYMLPSDMNLRIGNVRNYNNKILISSPSFTIGTNVKISLNGEKDKPDVKPKGEGIVKTKPDVKQKKEPDVKSNKEHKQDVKPNIELKQDVKMMKAEPDTNKITYEEEKVALVLGITSLRYGGCSSNYLLLVFVMKYVYINTPTPQVLRQPPNHFLCSIQNP